MCRCRITVKHVASAMILSAVVATFIGCGGGGVKTKGAKFIGGDDELVTFMFSAQKNPALPSDVHGVIDGSTITCVVPHNADVSALVSEYTTNSANVQINGLSQTNGVSTCDFSSPVVLRVYAGDGSFKDYTVIVNRAPGTDKKITSFAIMGAEGTIDEYAGTVRVTLPPRSDLRSATASFAITGVILTVDGVEQVSGITVNDYTSPIVYRVTAEDGSIQDYIVTTDVALSPEKEITSFKFLASDNQGLGVDVTGIITGDAIELVLPYGQSPLSLAARFETSGVSVTVDGTTQTSGFTRNEYTGPVVFKVTAEDQSTREYTANVTLAKNNSKELVSFTLAGERGVIDPAAITVSVTFPAGKNLDSLTATFVATGFSVTVEGAEQTSGVTANDYNQPVTFTVRAEDGSEQGYVVTASRSDEIPGMWNFNVIDGQGYTVCGAVVVPAIEGNGLRFDGVDDYMLVPDSESLGLIEAGSLEVIFKVHSSRDYAGVVHKGVQNDFSDESYSLQFWANDVLRMIITNDAGQSINVDSSGPLSLETWYHVVSTWDASQLKLYIDGNLVASAPNTIGLVRDSSGGLVIGAQLADQKYNTTYGNLCLDGTVDRVVVYTRALGADEVLEHFVN